MATTLANGGEVQLSVEPTAHAGAAGGEVPPREEHQTEVRRRKKKLEWLNKIVFCVALLEWAGNAVGTLAFLWGTVLLLGAFCSMLSRKDFWYCTVMIIVEATRVFIRNVNDEFLNQWLFGSTRAFRWGELSFRPMLVEPMHGNFVALLMGICSSLIPVFRPEKVSSIIKVALLVITSQMLSRLRPRVAVTLIILLGNAAGVGFFFIANRHGVKIFNTSGLKRNFSLTEGYWPGGSLVFIRNVNDEFLNQWLFGSTRAFRWGELSFRPMLVEPMHGNFVALLMGICSSLIPVFRPEKVSSIIKVALLVITSQMLSRLRPRVAVTLIILLGTAEFLGSIGTRLANRHKPNSSPGTKVTKQALKSTGSILAWQVGTMILLGLAFCIIRRCAHLRNAKALIPIKIITALALACLPFFQQVRIFDSYYRGLISITVSALLLVLSTPAFLVQRRHFFLIVDNIMPILFFWSVMFPLPGITLELSFYMLFSAIVAVLIGNLQIPAAFLQVLLSFLRLRSLLGHRHHDYHPLPDGASPNMVPSIVVFFMLEFFQGSFYMIASGLGLLSLLFRRLFARAMGLDDKEWGEKAVNLYFRQAYQARKEKGLFRSEKEKYTPRLESFAIESLHFTSSNEMQIVGLLILLNCLQEGDTKSSKKIITEIVKDGKNIISKIIGNISYLTDEENSGDTRQEESTDESEMLVFFSLELVRRLAIDGGKISARFRQELSENPFFLDRLEQILNLEDCQLGLWEPAMDMIAMLALDEAARQEIGSTKSIIPKLMHAFLLPRENNGRSVREENGNGHPVREENGYERSLRKAAGEALANLTIMSTDNCWDILLADTEHNLFMNLIEMLEYEYYICVAANLLHNLCANSRDKLMDNDFGANVHLKSALPKVMQIIMTKEGKELEAALSAASQIGYVIPEDFAQNLESYTDAAAAELVEKLVNTLKSKEPSPECPRIRRVLVEMVISIVEQCPRYIEIFVEKEIKDTLNKVKRTPSRFEKYRVFLGGDGVVAENLPMRDLVDKAKRLIDSAISTLGA